MHMIDMETLYQGSVPFVPDSTYQSIFPQVLLYFLAISSWIKMGILDTLLSWFNRVVIIISVLCVALTLTAKQNDIPLSKASLRLCHLLSFRYGRATCRNCLRYLTFIEYRGHMSDNLENTLIVARSENNALP